MGRHGRHVAGRDERGRRLARRQRAQSAASAQGGALRSRARALIAVLAALTTIVVVGPSTQLTVEDYVFTHHGDWVGALGVRFSAEVVGAAIWVLIVLVSLLVVGGAALSLLPRGLLGVGARAHRGPSNTAPGDLVAEPSSATPASPGAPGS